MHLSALHIYPVKSCRGISLQSAEIDEYGLAGDRRFMVVNATDGMLLTQRTEPRMALIETALTADALILSSLDHSSVEIPRYFTSKTQPKRISATVWNNTVLADDCGEEVARWLSEFLDGDLRLVRMGAAYQRPVKPSKAQPGDVVSFADSDPFLVISEASLADLNARLAEPLPMNRFRPNLVVSGAEAYAEDSWKKIKIGDVVFRNAGLCARCILTTTDQLTAVRGKEPLKTLAGYRRDPADSTQINFGVDLIHEVKQGIVRVGDAVVVQ